MLDGQRLTFRLSGINNQNFVMRDEQTGTWWQQVSGLAIQGPLKGRRLTLVPHDELLFATWKAEEPAGRVLKTDERIVKEEEYEPADWEDHVGRYPVRVANAPGGPLEPRTIVVGIAIAGKSRAWPQSSVIASGATIDQVGDVPVVLVVAPDGKSIRAFDRRVKGQALTFVRAGTDAKTSTLLDLETLSEWNFNGRATKGELRRRGARARGVPARLLVRLAHVSPGHDGAQTVAARGEEGEDAGDSTAAGAVIGICRG